MTQVPLHRFHEFMRPTACELAALDRARQSRPEFRRREVIIRQADPVKEAYLLAADDLFWISGWIALSMIAIVWIARRPKAPSGPVAAD